MPRRAACRSCYAPQTAGRSFVARAPEWTRTRRGRREEVPSAWSEPEGGAQRRAAEAEVLQQLVVALVVEQRAVGEHDVAPLEAVADADQGLPGELGRAGADVDVVRREPAAFAPLYAPAHADDAVPEFGAARDVAARRQGLAAGRAVHRRGELPVRMRVDAEVARAAERLERPARSLYRRVAAGEGPLHSLQLGLRTGIRARVHRRAAEIDRAYVALLAIEAQVDEIADHRPATLARLARQHERHAQVFEIVVRPGV